MGGKKNEHLKTKPKTNNIQFSNSQFVGKFKNNGENKILF